MKKLTTYFSKGELALWGSSAGLILVSFFLFDRVNFMTPIKDATRVIKFTRSKRKKDTKIKQAELPLICSP